MPSIRRSRPRWAPRPPKLSVRRPPFRITEFFGGLIAAGICIALLVSFSLVLLFNFEWGFRFILHIGYSQAIVVIPLLLAFRGPKNRSARFGVLTAAFIVLLLDH